MSMPELRRTAVADPHQGENLPAFLHRINFSLDAGGAPRKPLSASLNSAAPDHTAFGSFEFPPLRTKTNASTPKVVHSSQSECSTEGTRESSLKASTSFADPLRRNPPLPRSNPYPDLQNIPAKERLSTSTPASVKGPETQALHHEAPASKRSRNKTHHELPVYALAQTLRASSIGATMAPGIPTENGGLGWSKYAPTVQNDGSSKDGLNKRTAESIARQAEIDARLSKLRSRRDPATEQRDEARRRELIASQKAAEEEHARIKAEKKKQAEEEAARLETERLKREKEEEERRRREKEEAERLQREKEEAERLQREKEEADRLQREREEAKRRQREKEEAERLQREKEKAERVKREKEEAEAAHCAALYERIDQVEEDGLSKIQTMQLGLQKSIEESTIRQQQISNDILAKKSEIDQVQETLQRLQLEYQGLQDAEASITAKLEADTRECDELQTVSEKIIERASTMRKEVEEKTLKSLDEVEAFNLPGNIEQQTAPAPKDDKSMPDDQSSTDSSTESDDSSQEQASLQHSEDKTKHGKAGSDSAPQSNGVQPKPDIVANSKVNRIVSTEPLSAHRKTNSNQSLENKFNFEEWPSQEARPFGGAQKRLVKLTNLPISSTVAGIQAFVWGGRIEKIEYTPGNAYAWILFMRGQDCEKYFSDTANGIEHPDGNRTIWVEMGEPVSVNETLRGFYDAGHTRCVRAVGADEDWGETALVKLASAKKRKLERIVNGANPKGLRVIEFRFTNIVDAGRFKVELQNDIDWEHCNIYFGTDPCEANTGIHQGVQ